jgi:phosphatidate cytidylyltransferase
VFIVRDSKVVSDSIIFPFLRKLIETSLRALVISLIFIGFGVLGDLFVSKIKRTLSVKDSSSLLPGHGGLLDRVDSYLLSFPVLLLFSQFSYLIP